MSEYYTDFIDSYVGRGASLDVFDSDTKKCRVITGEEKINDSIKMILSTRIGERVFLPEFGSNLHKVVFEPNDLIAADLIRLYISDSLSKWEKRIIVTSIDVGVVDDNNVVPVSIYYMLRNTNISGSYVYPYSMGNDGKENVYNFGTYSANI